MEKITKFAKFVYEESDEDLISELEESLNQNAEAIIHFFDSNLPREFVEIKIIPTKEEYDRLFKERTGVKEVPKWNIGTSYGSVIEYVSLHDYQNTSHAFPPEKYHQALEGYKRTIIHEYVHFIVNLYHRVHHIDFPLRYLNEGIAQYLSGQRDGIKEVYSYSLEDILNSNNCYIGWYLLTKYILEKYGKNYFIKLLENKEKALSETPRLHEEAKEYYDRLNRDYHFDKTPKIG